MSEEQANPTDVDRMGAEHRTPKPTAESSGPGQPRTRSDSARDWAEALSNPAAGEGGEVKGDLISGDQYGEPDAGKVLETIAPDVAQEPQEPEPVAEPQKPGSTVDDALDDFLGPVVLSPEEEAEREAQRRAEQTVEALRSGEAVRALVAADQAEHDAMEQVAQERPGLRTPEAQEAVDPMWDRIDAWVPELRSDPKLTATVIRDAYDALGGEEKFNPNGYRTDPEAQRYFHALGGVDEVDEEPPKSIIG